MKLFFFLSVVGFLSCHQAAVKFVPKLDSVQVVYKDSIRGPFIFTGLYKTYITFVPVGDTGITTTGKWIVDTAWAMKLQSDTLKAKNALHLYHYEPVSKQYLQILHP